MYDQLDHFETSALEERRKTTLRLVDAMLWQPRAYPAELVAETHASFTASEIVEIVFDVVRNAANKITVACARPTPPT